MTDGASDDGIFPVVVVKVNGVMCRASKDPGHRSSYGSANLVHTVCNGNMQVKCARNFIWESQILCRKICWDRI